MHSMDGQRAHAERVSEGGGDYFEVVDAFGVGLFVDAVERGNAFIFEIMRYGLVGREHEFFDKAVGDVALRSGAALHNSAFVKFDGRFGEIDTYRSAAL